MTGPLIGDGERAWWQRRAAAELAAILDAHQDLPRIAWTVGPAGSVLVGHVNGLAPAALVRATFTAWESALALGERREDQLGSGAAWVHAACRRRDVTVRLTATVLDEDEGSEPPRRRSRRPGPPGTRAPWDASGPAGEADGRGAPGVPR